MAQSPAQLDDRLPPPIRDFIKALRTKQVYAITDPSKEERSSFVPFSESRKYLEEGNHTRLYEVIDALFAPHEPPFDPDTILNNNYVAILCILVEIGKGEAIADFVQYGYNDHRIPFDPNHEPPGWPPDTSDGKFYKRFCDKQWRFCATPFERNMVRLFEVDLILPIVAKEPLDRGGTAVLHKIRLHSAYNRLLLGPPATVRLLPLSYQKESQANETKTTSDDSRNIFALKTYIGPEARKDYEVEVEAFRKLKRNPNPNNQVIGFYGNYIQGNSYNVILEFADKGSLKNYLQNTRPPHREEDIFKFWTGLFGILKAVDSIHKVDHTNSSGGEPQVFNGWHQDVKPENILVVSNMAASPYEYQFKLADLGVSHFQRTSGVRRSATAPDSQGTQTYAAPECWRFDNYWDHSKLQVNQNVDIWSLGCVYSEAAVWMAQGYDGVLEYRRERVKATRLISERLGDCFHDGQKPLSMVFEWHDSLPSALRKCDNITPRVWKMIEECMLLGDSEARLDARQLSFRSQQMLKSVTIGTMSSNIGVETAGLSARGSPPQPPEQPQAHQAPPPPMGRRSKGLNRTSDQNERGWDAHSSITPGPRAISPDPFREDMGVEMGGPERISTSPRKIPRSSSQRQSQDNRPNMNYSSYSEGQNQRRISEERPFTGGQPNKHNWDHKVADPKGKAPMRNTRGFSGQSSSTYGTTQNSSVHWNNDNEVKADSHQRGHPFTSSVNDIQSEEDERDSRRDPQIGKLYEQDYRATAPSLLSRLESQKDTFPPSETSVGTTPPTSKTKVKAPLSSKRHTAAKLPHLAIATAIRWRENKKYNESWANSLRKRPLPELPGEWLFDMVGKRDHIFIIDDAISMMDHWDEMCDLFSILAYLVKRSDKDGIDMYFTMSEKVHNDKNTSQLVEIARKRKLRGTGSINVRLEHILGAYNQKLKNQIALRNARSQDAPKEDLKPLSVYVFTNGVWTPKSDPKLAIENIVDSLVTLKAPASRVGIQLISFGNDEQCLKRLKHYDSGLGLKLDIVDHTRSNGNLWKMILGAIDPDADADSESDEEDRMKAGGYD